MTTTQAVHISLIPAEKSRPHKLLWSIATIDPQMLCSFVKCWKLPSLLFNLPKPLTTLQPHLPTSSNENEYIDKNFNYIITVTIIKTNEIFN